VAGLQYEITAALAYNRQIPDATAWWLVGPCLSATDFTLTETPNYWNHYLVHMIRNATRDHGGGDRGLFDALFGTAYENESLRKS
jgi:hypothetical protein